MQNWKKTSCGTILWNHFEFEPVVQKCCLKMFLIYGSGSHFVRQSGTFCAILVEGIMRNNSVKLFWIRDSGLGGDVVKKISYLELWQSSCSVEWYHLCNFGRGHHREHSCEAICNLDQWFRRRCRLQKKFTDSTRQTEDWHRTKTDNKTENRSIICIYLTYLAKTLFLFI